jgi:hypothetical protein
MGGNVLLGLEFGCRLLIRREKIFFGAVSKAMAG